LLIAVSMGCRGVCAKRLFPRRSPRRTPLQQFYLATARIFRARSTTMADVTCFMQA
jgi:hypothetical protein